MTLQQQIWRSKDADLAKDLAKYQEAIEANQMPDMITHWREAVTMIEHEMEQRYIHASAARAWSPVLTEAPF